MPVPDFQSVMLPLLSLAADEQEHTVATAIQSLGDQFGLTDEDRRQLLPSGRQSTFDNRVVGRGLTSQRRAFLRTQAWSVSHNNAWSRVLSQGPR